MRLFFWRFWLLTYLSFFIFSYNAYAITEHCPTGVSTLTNPDALFIQKTRSAQGSNPTDFSIYGISVVSDYWSRTYTGLWQGTNPTVTNDGTVGYYSYNIYEVNYVRWSSRPSGTIYYKIRTSSYQCLPVTCPDGGGQLNGSCDRSCDDIDMGSLSTPLIGGGVDIICVNRPSESQRQEECLNKCGSSANINSFSYNVVDGSSRCYCKEIDNPIEDATDTELQTKKDAGEDTLLADLTQQMRESNNESNDLLRDTNSLLSELTESQTSSLDSLNTDLTTSLDTLNSDLDTKLTETNQLLEDTKEIENDSKGFLEDIYGAISDYMNWFFAGNQQVIDEINSSDISGKLTDLSTEIENADSGTYDFTAIDFSEGQKGFMDTVISKYSSVLGFSSSYGSKPSNFTINLYGNTYTLLDFSILDSFVNILRTLFLSIAYFGGFMIFIRKA